MGVPTGSIAWKKLLLKIEMVYHVTFGVKSVMLCIVAKHGAKERMRQRIRSAMFKTVSFLKIIEKTSAKQLRFTTFRHNKLGAEKKMN